MPRMVSYDYRLDGGRLVACDRGSGSVQVVVNPDDAERKRLIEGLGIDEHTLQSALDPDELARLEFEHNHVAIIAKRPKNYSGRDKLLFKTASVGMFLFREQLVVLLTEDIPLFDGKPFQNLPSLPDVVLRLLSRFIHHFMEHLKVINMISDEVEKKINVSMENKYLLHLFALEKSLVYYLNAINSNGVLIEKLRMNAAKVGFGQHEIELVEDLIVDNNQSSKQAEIYSNIIASLMDARASIVGNNLNQLMKTLNIITIGIMVPTFVVSAFSMNVGIPLAQHPHAFVIIMALAGLSVAVVIWIWRTAKW